MCGIIYAESFAGNPVNNGILQQYDAQKSRGQQGFGIFDGINNHMVHAAEENRILNWLCKPKNESSLLLMHHRFPTSTINVRRAAHPFSTKKYFGDTEYILVHNGHISNANSLYVAHQELGIEYYSLLPDMTFNDSEALLWDFALFMEGKQTKLEAYGGIAFICLKLVKGKLEKMYFARNTNPLNMFRVKEGILLSSEGEGEAIKSHTLYTWNYALKRMTTRDLQVANYIYVNSGYQPQEYTPKIGDGGYVYIPNQWEDDKDDYQSPYNSYNYPEWVPEGVRNKFDKHLKKKYDMGIDKTEVMTTAQHYLTEAHGHFEQAYWNIETDYVNLLDELELDDTYENRLEARLVELTLDYISNDPDYTDETSISTEWESVWQQQNLAR